MQVFQQTLVFWNPRECGLFLLFISRTERPRMARKSRNLFYQCVPAVSANVLGGSSANSHVCLPPVYSAPRDSPTLDVYLWFSALCSLPWFRFRNFTSRKLWLSNQTIFCIFMSLFICHWYHNINNTSVFYIIMLIHQPLQFIHLCINIGGI